MYPARLPGQAADHSECACLGYWPARPRLRGFRPHDARRGAVSYQKLVSAAPAFRRAASMTLHYDCRRHNRTSRQRGSGRRRCLFVT